MAKKVTCAHRKNVLTPCFVVDGPVALDAQGKCQGCGKTEADIKNPVTHAKPVPAKPDLTADQMKEMKKIHKDLYSFFKEMENAMAAGLVKGKKGWNSDPAWSFLGKMEESFNNIKAGLNIEKESVDLANFCMMIHRKAINA